MDKSKKKVNEISMDELIKFVKDPSRSYSDALQNRMPDSKIINKNRILVAEPEKFITQQQREPCKLRQKKKSLPGSVSTDQGQVHPEQQELTSITVNGETHSEQHGPTSTILGNISEKSVSEQQGKPRKRRQKKKSLQSTMSEDQCQTHPDQQESTTISESKDHQLEEGLGMPIIRGKLHRVMGPPSTVFLSWEDLEFIPPDGGPLQIEDISYCESADVKAQQRLVARLERELVAMQNTTPVECKNCKNKIDRKLRELSQERVELQSLCQGKLATLTETIVPPGVGDALHRSEWKEKLQKVWRKLSDDVSIRSHLKSGKGKSSIYICGSLGIGCGAILRDTQFVPIVARSERLYDKDTVSTFYSRLKGVALGVKIALDYGNSQFFLKVPSFYLYNFVEMVRHSKASKREELVRSVLHPEDRCDIVKICSLTTSIITDLAQLPRSGASIIVQPVLSIHNKAAEHLANLGLDQNMKLASIGADETLFKILYANSLY